MFIHWGPVSLKGTEIGWSRNPGPNGARGGSIPATEYDALYKQFNPTNFNAREWVAIAKAAGMRYLVFTTKHHDGFCEFDSKLTDYKVTSPECPFRRDVVKELADACREAGLRFGMYYSQPDEHQPDYRTTNHVRYVEYLHGQVRELLSNYGRVDVLWFDGLGGSAQDWGAEELFSLSHELQPGILINNRCGLPGDFDTPEQVVGKFQTTRPWETCMTLCRQWAWKPQDRMKSLKECLDALIRCAGGDGNLLFNVGPMPDGRIEPRQVERLKEMGAWLAQYGDSIYSTRGGPWKPSNALASTRRGNTVFLHVLHWPSDSLVLPKLAQEVVGSSLLTGGKVEVKQTGEELAVQVPAADRQELDTIVKLSVAGSALELPVSAGEPR
jgi:alpha-L-fucosidase